MPVVTHQAQHALARQAKGFVQLPAHTQGGVQRPGACEELILQVEWGGMPAERACGQTWCVGRRACSGVREVQLRCACFKGQRQPTRVRQPLPHTHTHTHTPSLMAALTRACWPGLGQVNPTRCAVASLQSSSRESRNGWVVQTNRRGGDAACSQSASHRARGMCWCK